MSLPNLSALAVRERSVTLFFLLLSVVAGFYAFSSLGRAEDPAFTVRARHVASWVAGTSPRCRPLTRDGDVQSVPDEHVLQSVPARAG